MVKHTRDTSSSKLVIIVEFEFFDPGILDAGDFELALFATMPQAPEQGIVPAYNFQIRVDGQAVGQVNLRIGATEFIQQYAGNLGYRVDPPFRGRRVAARAIHLLLPLARHHGMKELWISCHPDNTASRRTCELVGAELVEINAVPPGNYLYDRGDRWNCRYRLRL